MRTVIKNRHNFLHTQRTYDIRADRFRNVDMAPTTAATASLPTLTQSGARVALQAAEQHALEMGVPM